jgi:hypothetical protein
MKKRAVIMLLVLVCLTTAAFAGNIFVENLAGKRGTGTVYISGDGYITPKGNFPQFKASIREFYAEKKNEYTVTNQGHFIVQGENGDGEQVRLSVKLDKPATYVNHLNHLHVYTSGKVTYWKKGSSPISVDTEYISWSYYSGSNHVSMWGGYDTDYAFNVYGIEVE